MFFDVAAFLVVGGEKRESEGRRMTVQEREELGQIEQSILTAVEGSTEPYPPKELFVALRKEGFSEDLARAAIWFLVDANRLGFDRYRQLISVTLPTRNG